MWNKEGYFSLTICSYHVTYVFQSESRLYGCLNVKELLVRNRCEIWPVWLNGCVFVYELSGCGFESSYSHLNFVFFFIWHLYSASGSHPYQNIWNEQYFQDSYCRCCQAYYYYLIDLQRCLGSVKALIAESYFYQYS